MTSTKIFATVSVPSNKDSGSLPVQTNDLPEQFRTHGLKPSPGSLQFSIDGGPAKDVTYIMGSPAKGWHLCSKGGGKIPTDTSFTADILVAE